MRLLIAPHCAFPGVGQVPVTGNNEDTGRTSFSIGSWPTFGPSAMVLETSVHALGRAYSYWLLQGETPDEKHGAPGGAWDASKISNKVYDASTASKGVDLKEPLAFFCNGQRIFIRGVNWGMDEGMLRCDREGFQNRLRMEKGMNFNLIRNWAGNLE